MLEILTEGNGISKTHVSLEDVNEVIKTQLGTDKQLGSNTKYTVIGEGNGFMSKVILVEADWQDEKLPKRFVLKIAYFLYIVAMAEKMKNNGRVFSDDMKQMIITNFVSVTKQNHNREVEVYRIFNTWNSPLNSKSYFSKKFDEQNTMKGFIGMDYVDEPIIRHIYDNVQAKSLHPVLKMIASMQAKSLDLSESDLKSFAGFDVRTIIGDEERRQSFIRGVKRLDENVLGKQCDILLGYGAELVDLSLPTKLNEIVGIEKSVMVHGDLWSANIIWQKQGDEYSVNKVIDYQLVHMGNPAEDLVRLLLSSLSGQDFTSQWESLLDKFYEYFLEELGHRNVPYTLEQLKESFQRYYLLGAFLMLPIIGLVADTRLSMLQDDEQKRHLHKILVEKSTVLLDNMIKYYELYKK